MPEKPVAETAVAVPDPPQPPRVSMQDLLAVPDSDDRRRWMNALVQSEIDRQQYLYDLALAKQFAMSGKMDDLTGNLEQARAQAFLKIRTGRDLGLSPTDSMKSIYFATNGIPSLMNDIFAARLKEAGYDWTADFEEKDGKTIKCTLWLLKRNPLTHELEPMRYQGGSKDGQQISESFGLEDARTIKIWENKIVKTLWEKWNFQSWPRNMFFARAMSRLRQFHFPHILRGIIPEEERFDLMHEPEGRSAQRKSVRATILDTQAEPTEEKKEA